MHFYFEMRIGFLFLFLERGMKNKELKRIFIENSRK